MQVGVVSLRDLPDYLRPSVTDYASRFSDVPLPINFYRVCLVGVTPLLMHRFSGEAPKGRRKYDPVEEAEKAVYRNNGVIYIPSRNITALLRDSAEVYKFGGKRERELKEGFMRSIIAVLPEEIPIFDPRTGELVQNYEISEMSVIHNPKAGRVLEWRPMFRNWMLEFVIALWMNLLGDATDYVLREILVLGGAQVGLGDFRGLINKSGVIRHVGGPYGRFKVTKFDEVVIEQG